MNTADKFTIDFVKLFADFEYYRQVVDYQNQNGLRCFTVNERLQINEATDIYLIQGKIVGDHKIESLALFV